MKSFHIKFAIISCTLALTACGAGETETDTTSIDEVGSSAYQQALGANGDVDCDRIHEALLDHGIDPAQLEPDFVFEACVNSGTPEDTCQLVAYTCFGDQGCTDPHPPQPPHPEPECEELYELAEQSGIDPWDVGPDQAFEACMDANYPDDICVQVFECFDNQPNPPQPPQPPMCDEARELAEQLGLDIDNMGPQELLDACVDQGYDEQTCWMLIEQCADQTDPNDPTDPDGQDPSQISCDEVVQELEDRGVQVPLNDNDAAALYQECVAQTNDDQLCHALLECVI